MNGQVIFSKDEGNMAVLLPHHCLAESNISGNETGLNQILQFFYNNQVHEFLGITL